MLKRIDSQARRSMIMKVGIVAVVVILVIVGVYFVTSNIRTVTTTTTSTSTVAPTTATVVVSKISSCSTISSPGTYYLTGSISTSIQNGSCIDITSSNVKLIGNGNGVQGSGPYVAAPPYSYGILIGNVTNVTVTGVTVSKFSYNFYFSGGKSDYLTNSSSRNATISGIFLDDAYSDYILNDNSSGTSSSQGGIDLQGGGNTTLRGDIMQDNAYYGLLVNSSHNNFAMDSFIGNPIDLACVGSAGYRSMNNFSSSSCYVDQYCSFARCAVTNEQFNLSARTLPPEISTCGTIASSGSYSLQGSINVGQYVNTSALPANQAICISITTSNVHLSCGGNYISDAGYGIYASSPYGLYNITIDNCGFSDDTYGVGVDHAFQVYLNGISASDGNTGIYLSNVTTAVVSNSAGHGNEYGLFMNATSGVTLSGLSMENNTDGIYVSGNGSDIYDNDALNDNSKIDLACSISAYSSLTQTLQGVSCGTTSCVWATSCGTYIPPTSKQQHISSCSTISAPGNYTLNSDIITTGSGTCLTVDAPSVSINCNGYQIIGTPAGTAFVDSGKPDVTLDNCVITSFGSGVTFSNANNIILNDDSINSTNAPLTITNSYFDRVTNVNATESQTSGLVFDNVENSSITNDQASHMSQNGFTFSGDSHDVILYDVAQLNTGYGFAISTSKNNQINNDTGSADHLADYYCSPDSSGLYANGGGINSGVSKIGCTWMVVIPSTYPQSCEGLNTAAQITLDSDMLYTYGTSCFTVYANDNTTAAATVIDCDGHTVFATDGGTFVDVVNASGVEIENCVLKGFTTPIISTAESTEILNNTIGNANVSITLSGSNYQKVHNNTILNSSYGIFDQDTYGSSLLRNNLTNDNIGIYLAGDSQSSVKNNTVIGGKIGIYMVGSFGDQLFGNMAAQQSTDGIACTKGAENTSNQNIDQGQNVCQSNSGCAWMTLSTQCKA